MDGMLGKLTRWLRIIGFDTKYLNNAMDNELIKIASLEDRILLTSDVRLYRVAIAKGVNAFLIKGRTNFEKLAYLAKRFNIDLKIDENNLRCPVCGSRIELITKNKVKDIVPEKTFKNYKKFWICSNKECKKVYWKGSHWKRINEVLNKANMLKNNLIRRRENEE
ncbi:MAG: Mut7-C RNAse domain-containing protein [Candidatus Bathyarchaeia archaeon]